MNKGLTMIELLLVMALLAILSAGVYTGWTIQIKKSRDAVRKSDLNNMAVAIRHYQEDNNCFPKQEDVECASTILTPYIETVPCDPINSARYHYKYTSPDCRSFILYTNLENTRDEIIGKVRCSGGCGVGGAYNYYVSSGNIFPDYIPPTPTATPSPTPTPIPEELPGECGGTCTPNACGNCCPGSMWRCNAAGNTCIRDLTCP